MQIAITTIPHIEQRYPTCGDWIVHSDGSIEIRVSDTGEKKYNFLIALHEFVEAALCTFHGIPQISVDRFDTDFESKRQEGNTDEPGDDDSAPYHYEHVFATCIERLAAMTLGVDWKEYSRVVENL